MGPAGHPASAGRGGTGSGDCRAPPPPQSPDRPHAREEAFVPRIIDWELRTFGPTNECNFGAPGRLRCGASNWTSGFPTSKLSLSRQRRTEGNTCDIRDRELRALVEGKCASFGERAGTTAQPSRRARVPGLRPRRSGDLGQAGGRLPRGLGAPSFRAEAEEKPLGRPGPGAPRRALSGSCPARPAGPAAPSWESEPQSAGRRVPGPPGLESGQGGGEPPGRPGTESVAGLAPESRSARGSWAVPLAGPTPTVALPHPRARPAPRPGRQGPAARTPCSRPLCSSTVGVPRTVLCKARVPGSRQHAHTHTHTRAHARPVPGQVGRAAASARGRFSVKRGSRGPGSTRTRTRTRTHTHACTRTPSTRAGGQGGGQCAGARCSPGHVCTLVRWARQEGPTPRKLETPSGEWKQNVYSSWLGKRTSGWSCVLPPSLTPPQNRRR
ncbi:uncharacterized protein [Vulpes vulpes]|uniref:Collagen alpha-1(I) chain-like n=1 Tax=Vulpes vulpes TaxID=9627 RepID=A0ABM4ZAS0_VULVU